MNDMKTNEAMNENGFKVGDFLYSSWGWEQTNVNFFKVVGVTAKCLKIVPVKSKKVSSGGSYNRYVVPTDTIDRFCVFDSNGDVKKQGYMLKKLGRSMTIRISSDTRASKWDGRPVAESTWY